MRWMLERNWQSRASGEKIFEQMKLGSKFIRGFGGMGDTFDLIKPPMKQLIY